METLRVYETDDEVQALALQEALESEGIAAVLISHRDTAYPGITDRQRHGTEIRVEGDQVEKATQLIDEFLAAQPVEGPPIAPPPDSEPRSGRPWARVASYHPVNAGFTGSRCLYTKCQISLGSCSFLRYKLTVSKGSGAMFVTDTYDLKELAKLLNWNPAHCKVILKQLGADPSGPIDEETAAKVARQDSSTLATQGSLTRAR